MFCYLQAHRNKVQKGYIGDGLEDLFLLLFADADLGSDTQTSKSTSGALLVLVGPNSFFPLLHLCHKQKCVARASAESELVSLDTSLRLEALPLLSFIDVMESVSCGKQKLCNTPRYKEDQLKNGLKHIKNRSQAYDQHCSQLYSQPAVCSQHCSQLTITDVEGGSDGLAMIVGQMTLLCRAQKADPLIIANTGDCLFEGDSNADQPTTFVSYKLYTNFLDKRPRIRLAHQAVRHAGIRTNGHRVNSHGKAIRGHHGLDAMQTSGTRTIANESATTDGTDSGGSDGPAMVAGPMTLLCCSAIHWHNR